MSSTIATPPVRTACNIRRSTRIGSARWVRRKSAIDTVVLSFLDPILHVQVAKLDVAQPHPLGALPRQIQLGFIHVDTDNLSLRADRSGELQSNVPAATTEVDTPHPGCKPRLLQYSRCAGPQYARHHLEPLLSFDATTDNIACHVLSR